MFVCLKKRTTMEQGFFFFFFLGKSLGVVAETEWMGGESEKGCFVLQIFVVCTLIGSVPEP
jgi:hypothetical protein